MSDATLDEAPRVADRPQSGPAQRPAASAPSAPAADDAPPPNKRRKWFMILAAIVVIGGLVWAAMLLFGPPSEETDDAYVAGDIVTITARDPGTVTAVYAENTEAVKRGQPLIDLDPSTSDVGLAAAEAELARAVRATRSDFSKVNEATAGVAQAQAELTRARNDLTRRQGAAAEGAVSGEEVAHARDTVNTAAAQLRLAQSQLAQARSSVQGTAVGTNPAVLAAIAQYRRAAITRGHMHVTAPIDGVVAQRNVQVGQQVAPGTPLMAVVPLKRVWVDANFRETQLRDLRIGQPVTITTDTYGSDVVYHGKVAGLGAGSGNAFALLPPQNASGNWIKIVQRVPVRINLDPKELDAHPLRIGLSVMAEVETKDTSGTVLGQAATADRNKVPNIADDAPDIDAKIAKIIAENSVHGQ